MSTSILAACVIALSHDAPTVASAFPKEESAVWIFEQDEKRIGYHTAHFVGLDELAGVRANHFQGAFKLTGSRPVAVDVLSTGDLWTDELGHPLRWVQQVLTGDSYSRVELSVNENESRARIVQGPSSREVTVAVDPAAYLLANNFISHLELVGALLPAGKSAKLKLFSGSTLQGLDFALTSTGAFEDEIDGRRVKGEAYDDSLGEHLRFVGGRIVDISVKAAKLVIRRSNEHVDPIVITPPEIRAKASAFDCEEVKIRRDDALIAGTITKKKGASGRLPAVFFISGSGAQDRNGFSSGLDLGTHEILDHLTEQGFLVLRVDDRGTGESSAMSNDASYLDLIADARTCVEFLEQRADVDTKRIVLVGHSEGGETAPILAVEKPELAAIVLMAPPGRPIVQIIEDQNRLELEKAGLAKDAIEKQLVLLRAFFAKLAGDEPMTATSEGERTAIASRNWFRSHAKFDPIATIRKVKCPVLVLQGEKDFQVSPEKDAKAIDAALAEVRHPDHTLRVLRGLDHLFAKTPGEKSELADYWKKRPIDPTFFAALDDWLKARLKP